MNEDMELEPINRTPGTSTTNEDGKKKVSPKDRKETRIPEEIRWDTVIPEHKRFYNSIREQARRSLARELGIDPTASWKEIMAFKE